MNGQYNQPQINYRNCSGGKHCTNASPYTAEPMFYDNYWACGIHHPVILSDTTLTTECPIFQQAMDDGNKSKKTHSDSNKIPLGLYCKPPQKNHAHRVS
jgi:hypothetical protein